MVKKKCETKYCKNRTTSTKCSTCRSRISRKNDPVRYSYITTKNNAKRRGKPFTLTLAYFRKFCYETNYIQGKGKTKTSYSIDCIENEKGYVEGNIRILPLGDNSRKGTKTLSYDYQTGYATVLDSRAMVVDAGDNYF